MVRLEVIEIGVPADESMELLKAYAGVADDGQDAVLMMALLRALSEVQRAADVALMSGRYRVCADDHPRTVRVYMGGTAVKATDDLGNAVSFHQRGSSVYVSTNRYVEVEFTTEVNEAEYMRLLPVVMRYATGIYDGLSARELNAILKEC